MSSRIVLSIFALFVSLSLANPALTADDAPEGATLEEKRQAELFLGVIGGRPIEERPGKLVRGSDIDAELYPGVRPDDELKIIRDEALGLDLAVNLTLHRKWRETIGGDATEWTGKIAPTVKPGVVITQQNYKEFEGLDQLLPPSLYKRLEPGAWDPIKEIRVGETDPIFPSHEYIDATRTHDYARKGFAIKDWKGGLPFEHPKDGDEILINYLYRYWADDLLFKFKWYLVGAGDKLERTIKGRMFALRLNGRTMVEPKPVYGDAYGHVLEKLGTIIESPKDVRGVALTRTRHVDLETNDSMQIYIPALRRVRRLSGRDTQDPIVGTDVTWDDFVIFYQQVRPDTARVELVGEGEILHASAYTKPRDGGPAGDYIRNVTPFDMTDVTVSFKKWQRRPVWIIDVVSKDPSYIYSKRRLWVDKEVPNILHGETWDRKGNFWKTLRGGLTYNPTNGDAANWDYGDFADDINQHRTTWIFEWESLPGLDTDYFDTALLTKHTQ